MLQETGFFQDDGLRLAGDLVLPPAEPAATLVMCAGFRGTRRGGGALELAERLAGELGWAVVLFDYGGFGASDGPRGRFDPEAQVGDIRAAVSYMLGRYPDRPVSLYGNSFGAGMAVVAAARDPRVASLFSLCAFSGGAALMADQRPHWQLVEFAEAARTDRAIRAEGGVSAEVDPDHVMVRDREASAYIAQLAARGKADRSTMRMADADRLASFEPVDSAFRLRGRPSLFAHCARDFFIPAWHSKTLAEAAGGRLVLLPYGHYAIYEGAPRDELLRQTIDFYREAVPD